MTTRYHASLRQTIEVVDSETSTSINVLFIQLCQQCYIIIFVLNAVLNFCSQRGSDEMVTSPGVEGGPVTNGDTMGTNHVDNNNDAKKVNFYNCFY